MGFCWSLSFLVKFWENIPRAAEFRGKKVCSHVGQECQVTLGVGLPLQECGAGRGWGVHPPAASPQIFHLQSQPSLVCFLRPVSSARLHARQLPGHGASAGLGVRLLPCPEPSLLPLLLKALPSPGRPCEAFPLAGPGPTHRPCDALVITPGPVPSFISHQ